MRILFCTHEPFWPLSGGGTSGTLALVREFQRAGNTVRVLAPLNCDRKEAEVATGMDLEPFRPFYMHRNASWRVVRYALYACLFFFKALWECCTFRPDVLLCKNCVLVAPLVLVGWLCGKPTSVVATDCLSHYFEGFMEALLAPLERVLMRCPTRGFVISPEMKLVFGDENLRVNGDAVDFSFFEPSRVSQEDRARARKTLGFAEAYVLYHGTIEKHHGTEELIATFKELVRVDQNVKVVLIAGGTDYGMVRHALKHDRIHCLDFVPFTDIPAYLAEASAGFLPYTPSESTDILYPYKFLEYYASGLPIVAFPLRALKRVFDGKPGVSFVTSSAQAAAELSRAVQQRDRRQRDAEFEAKFSWSVVARPILQEMEALVSSKALPKTFQD